MIDVLEEYARVQKKIGHNSSREVATLVLAKVLQEVGQEITTQLYQLPAELKQVYLQVEAGQY